MFDLSGNLGVSFNGWCLWSSGVAYGRRWPLARTGPGMMRRDSGCHKIIGRSNEERLMRDDPGP